MQLSGLACRTSGQTTRNKLSNEGVLESTQGNVQWIFSHASGIVRPQCCFDHTWAHTTTCGAHPSTKPELLLYLPDVETSFQISRMSVTFFSIKTERDDASQFQKNVHEWSGKQSVCKRVCRNHMPRNKFIAASGMLSMGFLKMWPRWLHEGSVRYHLDKNVSLNRVWAFGGC